MTAGYSLEGFGFSKRPPLITDCPFILGQEQLPPLFDAGGVASAMQVRVIPRPIGAET